MRWYVSRNGESSGPHEEATVVEWARSDQLLGAMLRDEAASAWVPLAQTPFASAAPAPAVAAPRAPTPPVKPKNTRVRNLVIVLASLWFVFYLVTRGDRHPQGGSSSTFAAPTPAAEATTAAEAVQLVHLLGEYRRNEVSADNEFKGKRLQTTGTVDKISKDIMDKPYVTIGTGGQFEIPVVQCMLSDASKAASLSPGEKITISGTVRGKMMNVLMDDCQID